MIKKTTQINLNLEKILKCICVKCGGTYLTTIILIVISKMECLYFQFQRRRIVKVIINIL